MERELIVTGIGGQGVQLATQVLARAAAREGRRVMMFGVFGGEMRGGRTETTLVVGDGPIGAPPIVSSAWSAVAMHDAFWGLVAPKVVAGGLVVVNDSVFEGDLGRDDVDPVRLPLSATAADLGSAVLVSMVLAGAYAALTGVVAVDSVLEAMRESVPSYRRQFVPGNERAIRSGADLVPAGPGAARRAFCHGMRPDGRDAGGQHPWPCRDARRPVQGLLALHRPTGWFVELEEGPEYMQGSLGEVHAFGELKASG